MEGFLTAKLEENMLIGTLPTSVSDRSFALAEQIVSHPLISAVRYNTGGDSPLTPLDILVKAKKLTDKYGKTLYVDLEGRQLRVARWTPYDAGVITLNRDFTSTAAARIHVRNAGWFDLTASNPAERKIYLENGPDLGNYYFGESQSVHVVSGDFRVKGYLGGLDREYISAAKKLSIRHFMLSFVEEENDIVEFRKQFSKKEREKLAIILKIESKRGVALIQNRSMRKCEQLMAARDDLFIGYGEEPAEMLQALRAIIARNSQAIVASRIFQGLSLTGTVMMGDISDVVLMSALGYKHFMFSDGLTKNFSDAIAAWEKMLPFTTNPR